MVLRLEMPRKLSDYRWPQFSRVLQRNLNQGALTERPEDTRRLQVHTEICEWLKSGSDTDYGQSARHVMRQIQIRISVTLLYNLTYVMLNLLGARGVESSCDYVGGLNPQTTVMAL